MGQGNTGPVQEFNIQCDPEAAHIVFESGVNLTMVPLEVTHTAIATAHVMRQVKTGEARAGGTGAGEPASRFRGLVCELLQFFSETYKVRRRRSKLCDIRLTPRC